MVASMPSLSQSSNSALIDTEMEEPNSKRIRLNSPERTLPPLPPLPIALPTAQLEPIASTSQLSPSNSNSTLNGSKTKGYELRYTLSCHKKSLSSVKFSLDGKYLASSSSDTPIQIHLLPTFSAYTSLKSHTAGISDIAFSVNSNYIASASDDKTIRVWEINSPIHTTEIQSEERSLRVLNGHTSSVFCLCWNPTGDLIASGGMDETVKIWDVQKGKCMKTLPAHSEPVSGVEFNLDGTMIVSGSWDGYIRIWDIATGQCLRTLVDDDNTPVSGVFFSPNSRFIFASSLDSTIRLWDYQADQTVKIFTSHVNKKYCIPSALTAGGKYLVTGSEDQKVIIWDLQTREVVQSIDSHRDVVMAVACHPTLKMIASVGLEKDPTVKIWCI